MVAMNEIVNITDMRSIPVMPTGESNAIWTNFKEWAHRGPYPHEEPSRPQLNCVKEVIQSGAIGVDFVLFGMNQQRSAKSLKGLGMVQGPGATFIHPEFKGPFDFATLRSGYLAYRCA